MYSIVTFNLMAFTGRNCRQQVDALIDQIDQQGLPDLLCFQFVSYWSALYLLKGKLKDYFAYSSVGSSCMTEHNVPLDACFGMILSKVRPKEFEPIYQKTFKGPMVFENSKIMIKHEDVKVDYNALTRSEFDNGLVVYHFYPQKLQPGANKTTRDVIKYQRLDLFDCMVGYVNSESPNSQVIVVGDFEIVCFELGSDWAALCPEAMALSNQQSFLFKDDRFKGVKSLQGIVGENQTNQTGLYAELECA